MDVRSRLPSCARQAADAVPAYTQVKIEDAPTLLKIPKSECPDIWIRLPQHKWPKSWSSMEDPVVPLERNLYGHLLAGHLWERQFENVLWKYGWEKVPICECLFVNREKGLFLSEYVDDIKLAGKKQNINPTWKILMKDVDLGNRHHFLTMFIWVALKENVRLTRILWIITKVCSNQGFLPGDAEAIPSQSCDMEGHAKECVERYCELANITTQQFYKVATPCMDNHHFKEEEYESVGKLSTVCSQPVLKCLYLSRIGGPDILWSVNKLARAIRKWTKACDKRLARWISYIHNTCEYRQYCNVGNTAQKQRLFFFKTLILQETLKTQNLHQVGSCAFFGSRTIVPVSQMCKKQTSVSHSSTEAEIISLDAGWRMDGIPALDLWDLVIDVFHSSPNPSQQNRRCKRATVKPVGKHSTKHAKTHSGHAHQSRSDQHRSLSIKRNTFWFQCYVVCLWGQWSRE